MSSAPPLATKMTGTRHNCRISTRRSSTATTTRTIKELGNFKKKRNEHEAPAPSSTGRLRRLRRQRAVGREEELGLAVTTMWRRTESESASSNFVAVDWRSGRRERNADNAIKGSKKKRRKNGGRMAKLRLAMLDAARSGTEVIDYRLSMVDEVRDLLNRRTSSLSRSTAESSRAFAAGSNRSPTSPSSPTISRESCLRSWSSPSRTSHISRREDRHVLHQGCPLRTPHHARGREAGQGLVDPILGRSDDYRSKEVPASDDTRLIASRYPPLTSLPPSLRWQ